MTDEEVKAKKQKKSLTIFVVVSIAFIVMLAAAKCDFFRQPEQEIVVPELSPANVELYMFNGLSNNTTANVELWLLNVGEKTATNITIHVRVRNENASVLFEEYVIPSVLVLRENESCTVDYSMKLQDNLKHLYHTIEISWNDGRHAYLRETD
jgi:hypothetical protein